MRTLGALALAAVGVFFAYLAAYSFAVTDVAGLGASVLVCGVCFWLAYRVSGPRRQVT